MKTSKSCYLPAHDARTGRLEFIAFAGLGLAGTVLIAMATTNALHFARDRECIVQAWSAPGPGRPELSGRMPEKTLPGAVPSHAAALRTHFDTPAQTQACAETRSPLAQSQITMDGAMHRWNIGVSQ